MATEVVRTAECPTVSFVEQYGNDVSKSKSLRMTSAIGGAALGGLIGKKIGDSHFAQSGNPLAAIVGALGGSVIAYKIVPEIATDIQRGNQFIDQKAKQGKSEGNLADRFKAILQNIGDLSGQKNLPTVDQDYDL